MYLKYLNSYILRGLHKLSILYTLYNEYIQLETITVLSFNAKSSVKAPKLI